MVLNGKFHYGPTLQVPVRKFWAAVVDTPRAFVLEIEKALHLPNGISEQRQLPRSRHGHDDEVTGVVDVRQVKIERVLQVNVPLLVAADLVPCGVG